ncbi:complex I subunit 4 family protein [Paenimyroides aestuarii]|uniref:NADH-quinone oxidoreductase subunit M n=1 Tax=Paenimyroides aestuarii TaxID=2968490 RepID=A0ABY5NWF1_9FLAO|nr:NADH-quinone oxidoreductase subunit M [Paenimyroides aestuarii]UUV22707.1 NADH-quinone oxidoreductase subunit M [Paenimyroides aestuarii]
MNCIIILLIYVLGAVATLASNSKNAAKIALVTSLINAVIALILTGDYLNGGNISFTQQWISNPNVALSFVVDGLSLTMVLLTTLLLPIIILASFNTLYSKANQLYALVLFMAFAMAGTFLAQDGLVYYIFWELALLPIFFIGLLWGSDDWKVRKRVMVTFFIYTFAGSLFMLAAFAYLYSVTGSFAWADLSKAVLSTKEANYIFLAFFLAYGIKIPVFPFHTWQANTYEKSPTIGTMLLSGIMLKMGIYSILRWQMPIAGNVSENVLKTVIVLCIIGIIYASLIALRSENLKRLLAYSSMAHVGLIAAGAYVGNSTGYQGAIIQMVAHGFVVVGLFYLADIIYKRYDTYQIKEMGGIRSQAPKFTTFFLIVLFASIGLPGTFGFIGEFTLLFALSEKELLYAIFAGTSIILGAYYMLKMFQNAVLGSTENKVFAEVTTKEYMVLAIICVVLIGLGIYPKLLTDLFIQ